jgi:hypothetical protein
VPEFMGDYHHRSFLLKWLYGLYAKKSKNSLPELKEALLSRHHKAIKIVFKKRIIHKIIHKISQDDMLCIEIEPKNKKLCVAIKEYFKVDTAEKSAPLVVKIDSKEKKERVKSFIKKDEMLKIPIMHIYNKAQMSDFLKTQVAEDSKESFIEKAYFVLGLKPNISKKVVKKHYRILARRYHPDMADSRDDETIAFCTKKFQNIQEAYEILKKAI